jgi:hypothetical protein
MKIKLAAAALVLSGCTTMAPRADQVSIVTDPALVQHCAAVGNVTSTPPYVLPGDDLKQLRNQAAGLGADTVLRTGPRIVSTQGVAYRCRS